MLCDVLLVNDISVLAVQEKQHAVRCAVCQLYQCASCTGETACCAMCCSSMISVC